MQEAGAARWSNSSQEIMRELETESEHREMSATLHHVMPTHNWKMFICTSSKSGKLLHLQNDDNMTIFMHECWRLYHQILLNYCGHQIYIWQWKILPNCLHVALETSPSGNENIQHFQHNLLCFETKASNYPNFSIKCSKGWTYVHRRRAFLHQSVHHSWFSCDLVQVPVIVCIPWQKI